MACRLGERILTRGKRSVGDGALITTAALLMSSRNKPRNSGDKGPEKNYMKKMMKKANRGDDTEATARNTFMKALKAVDSGEYLSHNKSGPQEDEL